jgi:tRNA-dihydrouridine synthase
MYFHPLQEEIGNLSEEEISKRIQELNKKYMSARRISRNPELVNQIFQALETYRTELRNRRLKTWVDNFKKARGEPDLGELINIE